MDKKLADRCEILVCYADEFYHHGDRLIGQTLLIDAKRIAEQVNSPMLYLKLLNKATEVATRYKDIIPDRVEDKKQLQRSAE